VATTVELELDVQVKHVTELKLQVFILISFVWHVYLSFML